ncbi:hypothetical protein VNO77_23134 [Canavalia gladiata]|uniref:Uncharacterized protein n=1 Tax=Canavalia gladiata TaxID=3824 RepID=A0AAN9L5D8_CANGL
MILPKNEEESREIERTPCEVTSTSQTSEDFSLRQGGVGFQNKMPQNLKEPLLLFLSSIYRVLFPSGNDLL